VGGWYSGDLFKVPFKGENGINFHGDACICKIHAVCFIRDILKKVRVQTRGEIKEQALIVLRNEGTIWSRENQFHCPLTIHLDTGLLKSDLMGRLKFLGAHHQ